MKKILIILVLIVSSCTSEIQYLGTEKVVIKGNPGNMGRVVDTELLHLRECQMFRYTPIPIPASIRMPKC